MRALLLSAAFLLSFITPWLAQPKPASRDVAITIDDLPYVHRGRSASLASAKQGTDRILEVLRAHKAPAVGFVNEINLQGTEADARTALLQQWVDAGMTLANHTYAHPDFNARTIAEFQEEITRGEAVTRRLMERRHPYQLYFRHPMTHTGDTREKKEGIERFLTERGYRIAPHTIENGDYIFNVGFARALDAQDGVLVERLRAAYLEHTLAVTAFAERMGAKIFGRAIPQVLLVHTNAITADGLDTILTALERRGYRFVTLDEVMRDAAYRTRDDYVGRYGPTWLFRWAKSLGKPVSFADEPEPPAWVTALYDGR